MTPPVTDPGTVPRRTRVLLVEDNEAARKGLARLLEAHGFEVATFHDGESALNALATEAPPDYVLTDLRLPDLDGREVAQRARQLRPAPRVALITGWDLDTGLGDQADWGVDWVLTKPVDIHELISLLGGSTKDAPDGRGQPG
jgi:DNA-binding response OmpR family regulator